MSIAFAFTQSHDTNAIGVFVESLRTEGPAFLFKGWTPAFIRLGPNTVLLFIFYEVCSGSHFRLLHLWDIFAAIEETLDIVNTVEVNVDILASEKSRAQPAA